MNANTCKVNDRDSKALRDRNGDCNLIARFRRTRKDQYLTVNGVEWGVKGRDGSDYYEIRVGADGVLYCSCPDYRIRGHKANRATGGNYICKHIRAFLVHAARMMSAGVAMDSECIIYNSAVTSAAIDRIGEAAASGAKSGRRVA